MPRVVRCLTDGCARRGIARNVPDLRIAEGIYSRPELFCGDCGSALWDDGARLDQVPSRETAVGRPPTTRKK